MGSALRYLLIFELHHELVDDAESVVIRTHRRWTCTNSRAPRDLVEILTDGVLVSRRDVTESDSLERLAAELEELARTVTPITDEQARQRITAKTGSVPLSECPRASCGAPVPIGSDRCGEGDSVGQVGNGGLTALRGRSPLFLRPGGQS